VRYLDRATVRPAERGCLRRLRNAVDPEIPSRPEHSLSVPQRLAHNTRRDQQRLALEVKLQRRRVHRFEIADVRRRVRVVSFRWMRVLSIVAPERRGTAYSAHAHIVRQSRKVDTAGQNGYA